MAHGILKSSYGCEHPPDRRHPARGWASGRPSQRGGTQVRPVPDLSSYLPLFSRTRRSALKPNWFVEVLGIEPRSVGF